ncbi:hypothetical protein Scep_026884 [Stephania cephalantha]|uniref:Fe2OG dioxygenase domain-containing protein n=1 Tax=Stephania cephalantha TaxID=152367 RepID=A0AAP0HTP7_9MAGN
MGENKADEYGSIPVPTVQYLAMNELKEIPSRYILPKAETDRVSIDESREIPVIDLQELLHGQVGDQMASFHTACKDWGFFQLINHGVTEGIIEKIKGDAEEFFRLPLEKKKAYAQQPESIQGYGQAFVVSEEQKLDWCDTFCLRTFPIAERLAKFWPTSPPSFSETIERYVKELQELNLRLLELIAKNLGVDADKLTNTCKNGTQWFRINYYPPCPHADKVIGISPHSDASLITLLIQVNEVEGLQIKKNGTWVPVKPLPGAFIVNIGDAIEILSNGVYKSIEHRGTINPERERLSIAVFQLPTSGILVGPFEEVLGDSGAKYSTVDYDEYMKSFFGAKLEGKRALDLVKLGEI